MNKNKLLKYIKENFTKKLIFLRTIIFLGALAIVLSIVLPLNLYFSKFEENTSIGNGFIYVIIRHNTGLSFSSFENNPTLSIVISSLVCSFVIILLIFQKKWYYIFLLSLTVAGSIFNICDKITNGYVLDYFTFKPEWLNTSVWNMPDVFVLTGVIGYELLYIVLLIAGHVKNKKINTNETNNEQK